MSGKIKSKDLSYDASLPPFLQRLRDQQSGHGDPDRHERSIARPTKARDPNDDDGPTVVDESGDLISKEEYEKLAKASEDQPGGSIARGDSELAAEPMASGALPTSVENTIKLDQKHASSVSDGAVSKKRKAAKVIGEDECGETAAEEALPGKTGVKKLKKKGKPIKLAFDDEEG